MGELRLLLLAEHFPIVFQVVMSYLSFLCARLLDLRNDTRAARVIQGAWRKYRLSKDLKLYQVGTVWELEGILLRDSDIKTVFKLSLL